MTNIQLRMSKYEAKYLFLERYQLKDVLKLNSKEYPVNFVIQFCAE